MTKEQRQAIVEKLALDKTNKIIPGFQEILNHHIKEFSALTDAQLQAMVLGNKAEE